MKCQLIVEGDMVLEKMGAKGHFNLQYMGGSMFIPLESVGKATLTPGACTKAVFDGDLRKADFGVGFQVKTVVSVK
jgi:hypothetical protein